jgi:hypothetical protein
MKERKKIISWGTDGYNCRMDWLLSPARNPLRKPGLIVMALWMVCFIAFLACMKYARVDSTQVVYAARLPMGCRDRQVGYAQQQATLTATATITPTLTATSTITRTVTATVTATLSPTATASPTWTQVFDFSTTPTASSTSLETATATTTPDLVGTLLALPTEMLTPTISGQGMVLTETATLVPFPKVTIENPIITGTEALNYLEAPPGANGLPKGSASIWVKLGRLWLLVILLAFWLFLAIWFLVVRLLDRD